MAEWDDEVDELYGLDPGEFVAARNALAKQIKAGGDKARGAEVAKLPRPSIVAWALNQAARRDPGPGDGADRRRRARRHRPVRPHGRW